MTPHLTTTTNFSPHDVAHSKTSHSPLAAASATLQINPNTTSMRSPPHPHRNGDNHPFHSTVSLWKLRRFNWNKHICSGRECNNGATCFSPRSSTYGSIGHDQLLKMKLRRSLKTSVKLYMMRVGKASSIHLARRQVYIESGVQTTLA